MNQRENFRKNLRNLISKRQVNQNDIAKYLEISNSTVSCWVSGKSYPEIKNIEKIARFFNVSIFELVSDNETDEDTLLNIYRTLDEIGKKRAINLVYGLQREHWYDKDWEGVAKAFK